MTTSLVVSCSDKYFPFDFFREACARWARDYWHTHTTTCHIMWSHAHIKYTHKRYVDISSYNAHHHDQLVSPQQHTSSYMYSSSASGLRVNGLSEINHWTYTCAIFTSKNVLLEHRLHRCCEVLQTHTCM